MAIVCGECGGDLAVHPPTDLDTDFVIDNEEIGDEEKLPGKAQLPFDDDRKQGDGNGSVLRCVNCGEIYSLSIFAWAVDEREVG